MGSTYSPKLSAIKGGKQIVIGIITALLLTLSKKSPFLESVVSALGGSEMAAIAIFGGLNILRDIIKHKYGINI